MIEEAIAFALRAHRGMKRKGKDRAYILHPIEAMTIAAGLTDDEEVIAAAVLHDTVEDTAVTLQDVELAFGRRVAGLVAAESEEKRSELPAESTWEIRKRETVEHLKTADRDAKLICLGDKLSNLRELAADHAVLGDALWERFNQKDPARHAWYYGALLEILAQEFPDAPAIAEYRVLLQRMFG